MHETRQRTVIQKYKHYECDAPGCTFSTDNNSGCCGVRQIMDCDFCHKDFCREHIHLEWVFGGDYPDVCWCDDCKDKYLEYMEELGIDED